MTNCWTAYAVYKAFSENAITQQQHWACRQSP